LLPRREILSSYTGKVCAGCILVGAITGLLKRFDSEIVNRRAVSFGCGF
jgi:hypothetical protein